MAQALPCLVQGLREGPRLLLSPHRAHLASIQCLDHVWHGWRRPFLGTRRPWELFTSP